MKRSLLLGSIAALLLTGCGASDTIRIGYLGPLTGDLASGGSDMLNATRLAVDEVNAAGGINGKQVELIAEDGRCNAGDAASATQKLVNIDKVVAIIGGFCSSESLAAAPIAAAGKVPVIASISSSPKLTGFSPYFFRNYPSDSLKGVAYGKYFAKAGFKKIAIISENTDFCQGIRSALKDNLPEGSTVVFDEVVDPGTKDFRTLFTRLKAMDVDLLFSNGQTDTVNAEIVKQLRALGLTQEILGADSMDSDNIIRLIGSAAEGTKSLSIPSLNESDPASAAFVKDFQDRFGTFKFNSFASALDYDATKLILKTIGEAGTGESLRDALSAVQEYKGVAGTFRFDKNNDVIGIPFGMKVFKGGKIVLQEVVPVN
jgi:branched-chain amino acid transport system substrate-binding protein